jgi:ribonuclease VapC
VSVRISAATLFEASMVADKFGSPILSVRFDEIVEDSKMVIESVTAVQARMARQAYRDYGKGSGHPANLNFGDCFSYALAREKREPILYKGDDFVHTDLRSAV